MTMASVVTYQELDIPAALLLNRDVVVSSTQVEWLVLEAAPGEILAPGEPFGGRRTPIMTALLGEVGGQLTKRRWWHGQTHVRIRRPSDSAKWQRGPDPVNPWAVFNVTLTFESGHRSEHAVQIRRDEEAFGSHESQVRALRHTKWLEDQYGALKSVELRGRKYG